MSEVLVSPTSEETEASTDRILEAAAKLTLEQTLNEAYLDTTVIRDDGTRIYHIETD